MGRTVTAPNPAGRPQKTNPRVGPTRKVAIVGLGYVGLPLALSFIDGGAEVVGLDVDSRKVDALLSGQSPVGTVPGEVVASAIATGSFLPTTSPANVAGCDAIVLCVPTPLTKQRVPDLTYVKAAIRSIGSYVEPGTIVALESTTYPGTTREVVARMVADQSGLEPGRDFFVVYSPEREDPGNIQYGTRNIPKLVGGLTERCTSKGMELYGQAIDDLVSVPSPEIAEMAKIFENAFRMVNIGLVNELKMACHRFSEGGVDIDVHDVIKAAATKPFGFMPFFPGPGLGGHCIPIDPYYLSWRAREFDAKTRLIELAGEINAEMPYYIVERLIGGLSRKSKALKDSKILVVGVAYKDNVDDLRESPALKIISLLRSRSARVSYHDPHVENVSVDGEVVPWSSLGDSDIEQFDAVLLTAAHAAVDYPRICRAASLVVDTRNISAEYKIDPERLVKA